ncbi:MAG: DoxX family membrane protein [Bacillota bacterium]|nr:DoxX family membrane protein [Bacillota bacterium]
MVWQEVKAGVGLVLRVWLGVQWLLTGLEKVGNPVWTGDKAGVAVGGFLQGALAKTAGPHPDVQWWYAWFVEHVALPNAKIFSYMVAYGEVLVGLGLILGAFTTAALVAGALMNLNFLLAGSVSINPIWMTVAIILLFLGQSGRYGVDGLYKMYKDRQRLVPFVPDDQTRAA